MQPIFLGIDLSTQRQALQGKTQVALAESHSSGIHLLSVQPLLDDLALVELLAQTPFVACGVDAPLSLPPCVVCRVYPCPCVYETWAKMLGVDPAMVYHYRLSDLLIRKTIPHVAPKPPLSHGGPVDITPLSLRWLRLTRVLLSQHVLLERIVEVYASGAIQLFAQMAGLVSGERFSYRASAQKRAALLCFLAERHLLSSSAELWDIMVNNEDALDAVVACLCAWLAQQQKIIPASVLLGLQPYSPSWMVHPLHDSDREDRQRMLSVVQNAPWVALPDPACF